MARLNTAAEGSISRKFEQSFADLFPREWRDDREALPK
jgi:hypothetical protein